MLNSISRKKTYFISEHIYKGNHDIIRQDETPPSTIQSNTAYLAGIGFIKINTRPCSQAEFYIDMRS
jgi:hypothetical protein